MGITADRIKTALSSFSADALPGGYYRLTKISEDLANIAASVSVDVALRLPTEKELRSLKYKIDRALLM